MRAEPAGSSIKAGNAEKGSNNMELPLSLALVLSLAGNAYLGYRLYRSRRTPRAGELFDDPDAGYRVIRGERRTA